MRLTDFIKKMPTGSPAAEIMKIALLIAGTVFVDRISEIVKDSLVTAEFSKLIDIPEKEEK